MSEEKIVSKVEKSNIGEETVKNFMHSPVITVMPSYSIKTTIDTFKNHKISSTPVVDEDGTLLGIISEFDLLIQASTKDLHDQISFTKNVYTVTSKTTLKEVLIVLFKNKLKHIPVVNDKNYVVGTVSRINVLAYLSEHN